MYCNIKVVGLVISSVVQSKSTNGYKTAEFALSHKWVEKASGDKPEVVHETRFVVALRSDSAEWANVNALVKGDKVVVIGSDLKATAVRTPDKKVLYGVLNLSAQMCTRVDPASGDYMAAEFSGALADTPTMQCLPSGLSLAKGRIAVDSGFFDGNGSWVNRASWYNVALFAKSLTDSKRCEAFAELPKGGKVTVRMQSVRANAYQSTKDGSDQAGVDITANRVINLGARVGAGEYVATGSDSDIMAAMMNDFATVPSNGHAHEPVLAISQVVEDF